MSEFEIDLNPYLIFTQLRSIYRLTRFESSVTLYETGPRSRLLTFSEQGQEDEELFRHLEGAFKLPNLSDQGRFVYIHTAFVVTLDAKKVTCCSDGLGLNYTLPMFNECKKKLHPNGSEVRTIPKLIPYSPADGACPKPALKNKLGIPPGHRVCRFPDCESNPCQNGWCEETMLGYDCHCPTGFEGKNCDEKSSGTVDTYTISTSDPESQSTPTSTGSTTPTDATTITPSDSTLPVTSPTSTSGPPTTTTSSAQTTVTPSDSTLPVTSSTSTARPPSATGSSAKIFVTNAGADAIVVSEMGHKLNFTSIPSTSAPQYVKYDPTERHIYWSDWTVAAAQCVYRSNLDGTDREQVTAMGVIKPTGIAIAERSKILYIAYPNAHKVTSMSIERGSPLPGTETDFVSRGISWPGALIIDEEEGFLYISRNRGIVRALLNAPNNVEEIYRNEDLTHLTGLSIDLTRHPRRIFFCDWHKNRTFYKEMSTSTAVELTEYMHNPHQETLTDVKYFKGTLYWVKFNNPKGIGIMTDYDQTNRSYRVQEISQFEKPRRMLIIT